jgi:hypothetical protein
MKTASMGASLEEGDWANSIASLHDPVAVTRLPSENHSIYGTQVRADGYPP